MKVLALAVALLFGVSTVAMAVPPGSGNWGGGPGNSGPGDQNGQNNQGGGGQTPPGQDKKLFDDGPDWLKGFVLAQGYDKDSPTDGNNGQGNDPGKSGKAPGHDRK